MLTVNLTSVFQSFKNPEGVSEGTRQVCVGQKPDRRCEPTLDERHLPLLEMIMREKKCGTYEVLLYIGSREGYKGKVFSREDLLREVSLFQDVMPKSMPVRITACAYVAGSNYLEEGHEISAIMYPNQYRELHDIDNFMFALAKHLMQTFKQNRITIRRLRDTTQTIMFESEEAEISRSIQNFNNANDGITGS